MKRGLIGFSLLLTACGASETEVVEGVFEESKKENSLTILVGREPLVFAIEEAECLHFDQLYPGSPVQVHYEGRIRDRQAKALRVEVNPTYGRLIGRWVEETVGENYGMGIGLAPKGQAYSIGMHTLVFKQWRLTPQGGLWLAGHSLESGKSLSFDEEWRIQTLEEDRLVLVQEDLVLRFHRETEADVAAREAYEKQRSRRPGK